MVWKPRVMIQVIIYLSVLRKSCHPRFEQLGNSIIAIGGFGETKLTRDRKNYIFK